MVRLAGHAGLALRHGDPPGIDIEFPHVRRREPRVEVATRGVARHVRIDRAEAHHQGDGGPLATCAESELRGARRPRSHLVRVGKSNYDEAPLPRRRGKGTVDERGGQE